MEARIAESRGEFLAQEAETLGLIPREEAREKVLREGRDAMARSRQADNRTAANTTGGTHDLAP